MRLLVVCLYMLLWFTACEEEKKITGKWEMEIDYPAEIIFNEFRLDSTTLTNPLVKYSYKSEMVLYLDRYFKLTSTEEAALYGSKDTIILSFSTSEAGPYRYKDRTLLMQVKDSRIMYNDSLTRNFFSREENKLEGFLNSHYYEFDVMEHTDTVIRARTPSYMGYAYLRRVGK
ncbi:hypothetical protein AB9P05_23705 [Roseivirga sp. BDSF3-8]|uniref:hypothetical protein n=1 Tax=Roseivirga sp. BDSF3-8 TaxID=3241598 RepID=UPI003532247B